MAGPTTHCTRYSLLPATTGHYPLPLDCTLRPGGLGWSLGRHRTTAPPEAFTANRAWGGMHRTDAAGHFTRNGDMSTGKVQAYPAQGDTD